jgi:hypothetical protein
MSSSTLSHPLAEHSVLLDCGKVKAEWKAAYV